MASLETLLNELFDGKRPPFYYDMSRWTRDSRRFRSFTEEHRVKIRAKIGRLRTTEEMADLRAELETAATLLRHEQFSLEYEKYVALRQRGADFTVIWKTHTPINIEVRRLRSADLDLTDVEACTVKLIHILADKIGQTTPGSVNLLWVASEEVVSEEEISRAMGFLRTTGEQKADDFFVRRNYRNASDFLRRYQQLSAIAVRLPTGSFLWLNPIARHKVPPPLVNIFRRL